MNSVLGFRRTLGQRCGVFRVVQGQGTDISGQSFFVFLPHRYIEYSHSSHKNKMQYLCVLCAKPMCLCGKYSSVFRQCQPDSQRNKHNTRQPVQSCFDPVVFLDPGSHGGCKNG